MIRFDVAIVGAGIAGAGLAAEIAPHCSVLLVEAENQPGYHATGRSAAFWSETYGGPLIQPLTSASGPWLHEQGALTPRGELHLARAKDRDLLEAFADQFSGTVALDRAAIEKARQWLPNLAGDWTDAIWISSCHDIDVARVHQLFLANARRAGAVLTCASPLRAAERIGGVWRLTAGNEAYDATILVDAAGAWADPVATMAGVQPIDISPLRRTVIQLEVDPAAPADLPLVMDIAGSFYFKPEAGGRLWLSPHDETPDQARDVAADELDVAVAIDRFQQAIGWTVRRVERRWAGLRSFAPDRLPVYGFDPAMPGFFWCAGQGGFGIQTAPAASRLAARLLLGEKGGEIDARPYLPDRFR